MRREMPDQGVGDPPDEGMTHASSFNGLTRALPAANRNRICRERTMLRHKPPLP